MAGDQVYTDVITVDVVSYYSSYELYSTFYLVKGIGVVGLITEADYYELENIDFNNQRCRRRIRRITEQFNELQTEQRAWLNELNESKEARLAMGGSSGCN